MTDGPLGTRRVTVWLDPGEGLDPASHMRLRVTVLRAVERALTAAGMAPAGPPGAPALAAGAGAAATTTEAQAVAGPAGAGRYLVSSFGDGGAEVGIPVGEAAPGAARGGAVRTTGAARGGMGQGSRATRGGGVQAPWATQGDPVQSPGMARGALARAPGPPGAAAMGRRGPGGWVGGVASFRGRMLLAPPETEARVDGFLAGVAGRIGMFQGVPTGRLRGNRLETGDGGVELHPRKLAEGLTVAAALGPGAFHLRPVAGQDLGAVGPPPGGAYTIDRIDGAGRRTPTGLQVVTGGLAPAPRGFLVYSPRAPFPAEPAVERWAPADLDTLAGHLVDILDQAGPSQAPALTAYLILSTLGPQRLTADETMDLLDCLDQEGRVGELLHLMRVPRFRVWLRDQGVGWADVYARWEPDVDDSGLLYAGFLLGAGDRVLDAVRLVLELAGAELSPELADRRAELFAAVGRFLAHPVIGAAAGGEELAGWVEDALWNLECFEAGRMLGDLAVVVLTQEPGRAPGPRRSLAPGVVPVDLEEVVREAAAGVRAGLGLRQAVEEGIAASAEAADGYRVVAERPLREVARLPSQLAASTVADYLASRPHLRGLLRVPAELLDACLGDLAPDLVVREPGGSAVVWDLSSRRRAVHRARTQLYAHILQDAGDLGPVRIGETCWAREEVG